MPKINLKRLVRLMVFCQINQKKKIMIILVMLHLKMVVVAKEVLVDLEVLVEQISQIYLKIFLVILEEEVEVQGEKVLITEVQI